MQHITLDYLYEEIDRHRKALKEIHEHCGRVCEEYEIRLTAWMDEVASHHEYYSWAKHQEKTRIQKVGRLSVLLVDYYVNLLLSINCTSKITSLQILLGVDHPRTEHPPEQRYGPVILICSMRYGISSLML
jgi:hypothetical protein